MEAIGRRFMLHFKPVAMACLLKDSAGLMECNNHPGGWRHF